MQLFPEPRRDISYVGDSDAEVFKFVESFVTNVSKNPEAYDLGDHDVQVILRKWENLKAVYLAGKADGTRSKATVRAKNVALKEAEKVCREYAQWIKQNPYVTDAEKIGLGIGPSRKGRTRRGRPRTHPVLEVVGMAHGRHVLHMCDNTTPERMAKPTLASHLLLFAQFARPGEMSRADDAYQFLMAPTRNPIEVEFDWSKHAGMEVSYRGRWLTHKGLLGPWSERTAPQVVPISASERRERKKGKEEDHGRDARPTAPGSATPGEDEDQPPLRFPEAA